MSDKTFGWCFIGAGGLVPRVMADFGYTKSGYLATMYSRTKSSTDALTARYGGRSCSTIEEAILDPNVQAVYVVTPNSVHREHTLKALELGKPVLCEKPFAMNVRETKEMLALAKEKGLFLMEGMWTRFNPAIRQALAWVREGRIGRVLSLSADFASLASDGRVFQLELGGGGQVDVGVYTVAFAQFVFGEKPVRVEAVAQMTDSGVDGQCAVTFQYADGAVARLYSAIQVQTPHDAWIYGEKGMIRLPKFWAPDTAELLVDSQKEVFESHKQGEGFQYEFDAAMEDILAGRLENELVSHAYTLQVMELLDEIRGKIGLRYPGVD
ncbi:MAG: Gfo/Idh/MocA family oxidoreductase [Oscillospiraceae bacterium]